MLFSITLFSSEPKTEQLITAFPQGSFGSKLEHFETNYLDYLHDARTSLSKCASACRAWVYPYNGENPPPTSVDQYLSEDIAGNVRTDSVLGDTNIYLDPVHLDSGETKEGQANFKGLGVSDSDNKGNVSNNCDRSESAIDKDKLSDEEQDEDIYHEAYSETHDSKYDNMDNFISMLEESDSPVDKTLNIEDSMKVLDSLISNISISVTESRTSTPRREYSNDGISSSKAFTAFCDNKDISSVCVIENTRLDTDEKDIKAGEGTTFEIIDITKPSKTVEENMTEFEVLDGPESTRFGISKSKCVHETKNATEFVEISMPTETSMEKNEQESSMQKIDVIASNNSNDSNDESFKSVENWFGDSSSSQREQQVKTDLNTTNTITYPDGILVRKDSEKQEQTDSDTQDRKDHSGSFKGDKSVRFSMQKPAEIIANSPAGVGISSFKHGTGSPTVGKLLQCSPFITHLFITQIWI